MKCKQPTTPLTPITQSIFVPPHQHPLHSTHPRTLTVCAYVCTKSPPDFPSYPMYITFPPPHPIYILPPPLPTSLCLHHHPNSPTITTPNLHTHTHHPHSLHPRPPDPHSSHPTHPQSQYIYIHDAINDYINCKDTTIVAHDLRLRIEEMRQIDSTTGSSGFSTQFSVSRHSHWNSVYTTETVECAQIE